MRLLVTILFLLAAPAVFGLGGLGNNSESGLSMLAPGFGAGQNYQDGQSRIVTGTFDANGVFVASGQRPEDFLAGMVFNINTNDFTVINGELYSRGVGAGGTYVSLYTNLTSVPGSFFTTNSRLILKAVPSFARANAVGGWENGGGITPPTFPTISISTDGGGSWINPTATNVPVLVSLYKNTGLAGGVSNVTVYSYVNSSVVGQTNDLTAQRTLVTQYSDLQSAVNVRGAGEIAAAAATLWANSPAVAAVNLAGHDLKVSESWNVVFTNSAVRFKFRGADVLTLTGAITTNDAPAFLSIAKIGTNLSFRIAGLSVPTVTYCTNIASPTWLSLPSQVAVEANGAWTVTAPVPTTAAQVFFRCSITGTASANAKAVFSAELHGNGIGLTNLPPQPVTRNYWGEFGGGVNITATAGLMRPFGVATTTWGIDTTAVTNRGLTIKSGTITNMSLDWCSPALSAGQHVHFVLCTNNQPTPFQVIAWGATVSGATTNYTSGTNSFFIPTNVFCSFMTTNSSSSTGVKCSWTFDVISK